MRPGEVTYVRHLSISFENIRLLMLFKINSLLASQGIHLAGRQVAIWGLLQPLLYVAPCVRLLLRLHLLQNKLSFSCATWLKF